tara:strand:+ start:220 stop:528 length:309 start_codon:yes stop_codon:yes gene_type:complete
MLDYFIAKKCVEKYSNIQENFNVDYNIRDIVSFLLALFVSVSAAYLAHECNAKTAQGARILITVFAFFFSSIYLFYYFIYYVMLDGKCNGNGYVKAVKKLRK